jgi:hypothetical protein
MKNKIQNADYIKKNYKLSTIARLADYGYEDENSINIDPDMTYALTKCQELGKENQDTLFNIIRNIQNDFDEYMNGLYPNGLFA